MQQPNYQSQTQGGRRPIDKGFIKVVIGQFPKKENGQIVYQQGTNQPVMNNKYTTIGEVTRWPRDNGGFNDSVEFYPGFTILDMNKDGMIFWDSQNQQANQAPAPQQAHGYNQAPQQTAGGYQQR